jgi:tetratricopeptide (TPR) repeat protein
MAATSNVNAQSALEKGIFAVSSLSGSYLAGRQAAKERDMDKAADFYSRALSDDPTNRVLIERGFVMDLSSGNVERAQELARQVVKFNKRHRLSHIALGLREARHERFESSRKHFAKAAYTPVGELTAGLLNAWSLAAEGKLDPALKALDALDSNDAFGSFKSFHAALIADFLGSPSRAEAAYQKTYDQAGNTLRVTQAYGNYLERTNRAKEAQKVYESYLSTGRQNALVITALENLKAGAKTERFIASGHHGMAEALFSVASALSDEQNIDVSLIYTQLALWLRPGFDVARALLGEIYEDTKRYEKAVEAFDAISADSPLKGSAEIQIAANLDSLKRTDEAIERLQSFIERSPDNYDAYVTLGNIQRVHEKWADAAESYSKAMALSSEKSDRYWTLLYFRGISYERNKEWAKAEPDFLRALELQPEQPAVLNYLGYSWIEKDLNLDKALDMVRKAVELRPNDGYIVDSLGWAHYQLGDYEEAVKHLERAVELRPEDPVINDHLGDAYWRVGRKLEAKFQWQHAKDNKPEEKDLKVIEEKLLRGLEDVPQPQPSADGADASKS